MFILLRPIIFALIGGAITAEGLSLARRKSRQLSTIAGAHEGRDMEEYGIQMDASMRIKFEVVMVALQQAFESDPTRFRGSPDHPLTIVDVGTGTATLIKMLDEVATQKGYHWNFVGYDMDPTFIHDHCEKRVKRDKSNILCIQGDATNFMATPDSSSDPVPLKEYLKTVEGGKFNPDAVIYYSILHEIYSYPQYRFMLNHVRDSLSAARDLLAEGGVVIIRDFVKPAEGTGSAGYAPTFDCRKVPEGPGGAAGSPPECAVKRLDVDTEMKINDKDETASLCVADEGKKSPTEADSVHRLLKVFFDLASKEEMRGDSPFKGRVRTPPSVLSRVTEHTDRNGKEWSCIDGIFKTDIYEFIFHKDYYDQWNSEMNEEYGYWTVNSAKNILIEAGFGEEDLKRFETVKNEWITQHRLTGQVKINGKEHYPDYQLLVTAVKPNK
uniref:Uncharacterized protein n=1 Tax=Chromera velia CCMP2878 TaxID=1169474 RepID=A0A0G4HC83_9ALVE|eukprot:Cvel_6236.t1-p1 / transcript=Cvel_6236.t1 / gene=Cvel_6236 / organism=Chromera_velia_CCMP2878 / gene_product=hypothetical protein / transcript_product=hypothetical protein / location=Cvel_scaffold302:5167-8782(-) / protein_length=439 / sequence_SO=supercontig / SO=protein_coding / is_pseudo=false